jgi:uncharacterized coiled-coil DUF342 family protein
MMNTDSQRLDRIEQKLDKMADAIVSLARMEERMVTLFKRMDSYDTKQDDLHDRVAELEQTSNARGLVFSWGERAVWILITLGLTAYFNNGG